MLPFLKLQNLQVDSPDGPILKGINLSFKKGEHVALIGPSGAGKTTLLKEIFSQSNLTSSFVPQNQALIPQLSLFHNVMIGKLDHYSVFYNLLNLIWPTKKEKDTIRPILKKLGIESYLPTQVSLLSGGERQRAAIARGLYRPSDLFLADEPVSSLDPKRASEALDLMFQLKKTVILSLHSVDLALSKADRVIGIKGGQVSFDLPAPEVTSEQIEDLYHR